MVKRRFALSSIMGAVVLMALAAGQTTVEAAENTARAEKPVLIPHTRFVFEIEGRGTLRREYLKKEGGFLVFKDTRTNGEIETYRTTKDLASVDNIEPDGTVRRAFKPHSGWLSFPLYVGKEWKMRYTVTYKIGAGISRERRCSVVGYENTTVRAGTFSSFIIKCTNQRDDRMWPAYERYAYAPNVGQIIHYTSVEFEYAFELVDIIPPPQQTIPK